MTRQRPTSPRPAVETSAGAIEVAAPAAPSAGYRALLIALCAFALAGYEVAITTRSVNHNPLLARLDIAATVLLVLAGGLIWRLFIARPIGAWSRLGRFLLVVYPLWWVVLFGNWLIVRPNLSVARLTAQAIFFRHPGNAGPPTGLSVGWILAVVVSAAIVVPPVWRAIEPRLRGGAVRRTVVLTVALVALAWAYRLVVAVIGGTTANAPYGALSHLPAQLDAIATGIAIAALVPRLLAWRRSDVVRLAAFTTAAAVLVFVVAVAVLDRAVAPTSSGELSLRHLLAVATAVLVVIAVDAVGAVRPPASRWWGLVRLTAPGLVLWYGPAVTLIARQYPERVVDTAVGRFLNGPATPVFLWSALLMVALALATGAFLLEPLLRLTRVGGRGRPTWLASPYHTALAGIVGGAFVWRVIALLTIAPQRTDGGDPLYYHTQANTLAAGRGFIEPLNWIAYGKSIPTALHGPAYTVYLSIFARLGGTTFFDNRIASSLVGAATVLVAALIAKRLAGPAAALVAATFTALYPNMWTIDGVLFPEGLFILCCGLTILAAYRWRDGHRLRDAVFLGLAIGAAALTRGEGTFLLVLLALPWMLLTRSISMRRRIVALAVVGVSCLVLLAPWMIRNARTFDTFVPLSTNGNELHVYSNCADTYSGKFLGFWSFACQQRLRDPNGDGVADFEPPGDEAQKAKYWQDVGFTYARQHLRQLPKVVAARVGRQWELFRPWQTPEFAPIEGRSVNWTWAGLFSYYLLAGLSIAGGIRLWKRKVPLLPLLAQVVAVTITAAYAYGTVRFRAPAELVLCVLGAVGAVPLLARARTRLRARDTSEPVTDESAWLAGGRGGWAQRATWWAVGIVAAFIALPLRGLYHTPGAPMEEGFMLTFPERVMKGDIPNVDFLHLYGPGSLDVLAAVYSIFGVRLTVERTFGLLQHVAIIAAIYVLARAWGRMAAASSAIICALLVLTPIGLDALAWNGGVALGLWSVVLALRADAPGTRRPLRWRIAAGVLAGLALTYRPDLVIALALGHATLLWRRDRAVLSRFAIGFAAGLLPLLVHLLRAGPVNSFRGMILDPVFNLRPGRTLPRPPSWSHLDGALQVIAEKVPPWWQIPHIAAPHQLFLWFFLLPVVAVGVVVVAWWRRRAQPGARRLHVLLAAGLFGVGLLAQALQRPDSAHLAWVSIVCVPLLPLAIIELFDVRAPQARALTRVLTGVLATFALMAVVMPFFTYRTYLLHVRQTLGSSHGGLPPGLLVQRGDRQFYLGDVPPWLASNELVGDLSRMAKPGERLLVGPVDLRQTAYSDAMFYYLFPELTPATKYIEMDPGMANAPDSGLAHEVSSADWLILTRFWSGWIEPNSSVVFGPDAPNQAVQDGFCLVGSYQHDLARLYHRCPGGGAPGPYDGPYDPRYDPAVEVRVPVPRRPDGTCTPTCVN